MIKLTIRVGYLSKILILCLLIVLPVNVFALENPTNSTILTENSQKNVSVSLTQNGTEISPFTPVQSISLATFPPIRPAPAEISPVPSIVPPAELSGQNLVSGKNTGTTNSSNPAVKDSQVQGQVNEREKIFVTDSRTGQKYVKDRVIVRFKSQKNAGLSISQEKIRMAHANVGAKVEKDFSTGGVAGLQLVQLPNGTDVQSAIIAYESNPDVLYAEPDYALSILPDQTGPIVLNTNQLNILSIPNDGDFSYQWSFHNTGLMGGTPGADIDAPGAWEISTGSNSVVVAVIDTGVLYNHRDLAANIWNNTGEIPGNGIDDDGNGYIDDIRGWDFVNTDNDPIDDQKHGTHVSGTIGAVGNNAIGVAGVNWHVKIMPLKAFNFEGSGSTSNAIEAIRYANANGASVISNSWGGPDPSQALNDAIDASPAIVVCAAGNSARNNDLNPIYPASYNSTNIISVAATDQNDNLALFSNFGLNSVDLAAPGTNIWSTYLDGNYAYMSGTSMATPHVSGVAALVKSVNQSLTSAQIKNIILSTVDVKSSLAGNVSTSGRLNAYRAVVATPPAPPCADFIGTPRNGTAPLTVVFTDLSANLPTTWNWSFGDGSFNITQNPVHTFGVGNFSIVLNASNSAGYNLSTQVTFINVTTTAVNLTDKIGIYRYGAFYLRNSNTGGNADVTFGYGNPSGDIPVAGDWARSGNDTIGIYRNGVFYFKNSNTGGIADLTFTYGQVGDVPVIGDWARSGNDTIGIYRNGVFYLRNSNIGGIADLTFTYGKAGDVPVIGDWNGDGIDTIGVYRNGVFYLRNSNTGGIADLAFTYGQAGDIPVAGDWTGSGIDTIGIYRNGVFYLRNSNTGGIADMTFIYGQPGDTPVIGDWNGK
jgi:subtilisin family serine protease